jgi:hypothetical protein
MRMLEEFDVRAGVRWLTTAIVGILVFPVLGEGAIRVAAHFGFYAIWPWETQWLRWLAQPPIWFAIVAVGGYALGAWVGPRKPAPGWVNEEAIKQLRLDVKEMADHVRFNSDVGGATLRLLEPMRRLRESRHEVWLGNDARLARENFLDQMEYTKRRMDDLKQPTWRTDMERSETFVLLNDAAMRLEAALTGQRVPEPLNP